MMRRASLALLITLQLFTAGLARQTVQETPRRTGPVMPRQERESEQRPQQQQPRPTASPASTPSDDLPDSDDVVRITSNLVQVDAVVTDKKGQVVTGLTADDFEILENDKPQTITNFSFVEVAPRPAAAVERREKPARNAPPVPPAPFRAGQTRRTITIVVDDLTMSFFSVGSVKDALRKFINEQVQPDDMVSVIRVSGGVSALEQFTNDKRQMLAAIERLRWYPRISNSVEVFEPIKSNYRVPPSQKPGGSGESTQTSSSVREMDAMDKERQEEIKGYREQVFTVGVLGALNHIVRGMKSVPGRKAIVLMSDGLRIFSERDLTTSARIAGPLRQLTDLANRSAVVFYTIDARGVFNPEQFNADDDLTDYAQDFEGRTGLLQQRAQSYRDSQTGLDFLARQTGGLFMRDTSPAGALRRVLDDQKSYYLIGYRPGSDTFKPDRNQRAFHKISVRVKRPDLRVRSRNGFVGVTDEELRAVPRTRDEQLMLALTSPFSANDIDVRLTSFFVNDEKSGSFIRSMLHLDTRDLTFTTESNGMYKTVIDIAALTFGDAGKIVDSFNRSHTIRVSEPAYRAALRHGLRYEVAVPVKKPGPYQLRIVVRDPAKDQMGAVGQFIEVPDLSKQRLALSGLLLGGGGEDEARAESTRTPSDARSTTQTAAKPHHEESEPDTSVRRFQLGVPFYYGFVVYNARMDRASSLPRLTRQVRLFREGQLVHSTEPQPLNVKPQTDPKRILVTEQLELTGIMPGEYVLQIVVTDTLASGQSSTASQWIDFELVR